MNNFISRKLNRSITLFVLLLCFLLQKNSLSAIIVVTDTPSLQAAITTANGVPDTILFANSITLTGPLPAITNTYTVDGANFTLDGGSTFRGFIMIGGAANPTIMDLTIQNVLAKGGDGGDAQDVRGGSGGGGLGAGGAIYAGSFAGPTLNNVTITNATATGGDAPDPTGGSNSGGGGGGGLGGNGGIGSGAGSAGGGGGGGGFLDGNNGGNGIANVGGAGGANGGGAGASTGVAAAAGTYGGGGGGASAANNAAGVSAAGGFGGGGGGGSSRNTLVNRDGAMGGFGAGGGGGGRITGIGGTSVFGGGTGGNGVGNQGGIGGGGAGLGGAVFVDSSSSVTIMTLVDPFSGNTVTPGSGSGAPTTAGRDIFLASGGDCNLFIQGGTVALANPIEADTLSASGGVEKLGPGILNFSGAANTYRGATTVTAGTLQFDDDTNLGNGTLLTLNGGTLEPTTTFTSAKTTSVPVTSFINVGGGFTFTMSGTISGVGGITKIGADTFIPTGANVAYTGTTTIDAGTIQVGADNNLGTGTLVLNGGTYDVTATFASPRLISITNPSTIQVTVGATTLTQNGIISSTGGSLNKAGAGTLELTAVNTFTVPTTVTTGTLLLSGAGTLGSSGDLTLTGGGFTIAPGAGTKTIGALNGAGTGVNLNNNLLQIASGTYGGIISGTGGIAKYGAGTLSLTGINTYTGQSSITGGVLELSGAGTLGSGSALDITAGSFEIAVGAGTKTIGNLTGAGAGINLNNNNLNVPSGTFTGPISGTGRINKITAGTLTLGGASTYSGGTEIMAGTLIVGADNHFGTGDLILLGGTFQPSASFATSKGIAIAGASAINLAAGVNLTVNGAVSGASPLTKSGNGTLTVTSGANTYTGLTSLTGGRLVLNNSSFGGVTMSAGTSVEGSGTLNGDVFNDGTISPGLGMGVGTLAIMGNYTQTANGTYFCEIHPDGSSDLINVSMTANLAGTLFLDPLPGIYSAGTVYPVLTAGTINNDFDQFLESNPLDFIHYIQANQVLIEVLFTQAILPVALNNIKGNAKTFAEYLFCEDARFLPPGEDIRTVINDLVNLPPDEFVKELTLLTPQQFRALPLTTLQNSMRMADAMLSRYNSHDFNWLQECLERSGAALPHDFWIQPLGYYYKQNARENEFGFDVRSFGWSSGVSLVFWDHLIVGTSVNYLYSKVHWAENAGKASLNMFSLGPSVGYLRENWFVNLAILAGRTFYDVDRTIRFSSIRRTAHNDHKSWDTQAALTGGYRFDLSIMTPNFYLQPQANLSVINVFESGYQESGANSLNLSVENKNSSFFKSLIDVRMIKDIKIKDVCVTPSIRVGWLKYVSLTDGDYTSRLYDQETCSSHFTIETNDKSIDQLVLGGEIIIGPHDHVSLEFKYEANIGDHFNVQEGSMRFQWDF